ncbi:MAG: NAD(P)H-binding protein, partial [Tepidisphaeraceae bacterium]
GFVGSAVSDELLERGYAVNALVNHRTLNKGDAVTSIPGGLFDDAALDAGIRGCDAVIHLVGIIMEKRSKGITFQRIHFDGAKRVIDAAIRNGVKRYVHMSALGARADAVSDYHKTKYLAEQYARQSGLDWTILRPSLIHGPGGEFMKLEAAWARKIAPPFLFMPYFGAGGFGRGGAGLLQPVHVKDVARAFVDALEKPQTIGEVYPIGGSDRMSWPELHRISAEAIVGHKRWVMALPAWYAKFISRVVPTPLLPFNRDQVIMSQETNTTDLAKFTGDFGWTPRPFEVSLREYAKQL